MTRVRGLLSELKSFLARILTPGSGESIWLIVAFMLGVTALALIANLIYGVMIDPSSLSAAGVLRAALAVAAFIGLAYAAYRLDLRLARRPHRVIPGFDRERRAPPHAGLVLLLSPVGPEVPLIAIEHHLTGEAETRLKHCWVLITADAQAAYEKLRARIDELRYPVVIHPYHLQATTVEATYFAVDHVYTALVAQEDLLPGQVICDITGGLKQMSAGMVLACVLPGPAAGRSLEYVETDRDKVTAQPIKGTERVVRVQVNIQVKP